MESGYRFSDPEIEVLGQMLSSRFDPDRELAIFMIKNNFKEYSEKLNEKRPEGDFAFGSLLSEEEVLKNLKGEK